MARQKTSLGTRTPTVSGSIKTPRKHGLGLASKGILKKRPTATAVAAAPLPKAKKPKRVVAPSAAEVAPVAKKKKKQNKPRVEEPESEPEADEEEVVNDAAAEDAVAETEEDDDAVSTEDDTTGEAGAKKARKVNYAKRRLRRMLMLQKSEARLGTEAGFKRIARRIIATSKTSPFKDAGPLFSRAALQTLQASVESVLQMILSDTANQVYTITDRNARITDTHITVTAEQRLRSMRGAELLNNYHEFCDKPLSSA